MKREVGLWIDHHKTVMGTIVNEEEETWEIRSNIEKKGDFQAACSQSPGSLSKICIFCEEQR